MGGRRVTGWQVVTEKAVLERLAPEARGQVLEADLKALGVADYGEVKGGGLELFFDEERMTLARWPNEGFVNIASLVEPDTVDVRGTKGSQRGAFMYEGDRPSRWVGEQAVWLHGYWFWDWSDERQAVSRIDVEQRMIELADPYHHYGYRVGQWYYAFNVLAELDRAGEWYLDRARGVLYFWPPKPIEEGRAVVSVASSLVRLRGASHVELRGMVLEAARQTAVEVRDCEDVRLCGCVVRNVGGQAVEVSGGKGNAVVGCDIYGTGKGGISLSGGDRASLAGAGHAAENNEIHHYGQWERMYAAAISLEGVGQRAAHNLIHDGPHIAILFGGNDHLMEFNEIHHVCEESMDAGAIYAGRDWTMRGTVIRYNYLHDIKGFEGRGCVGVYLDDMFCGTRIYGNVFYRVTRAAFIGGGRDCEVVNNLFVDCEPALHIDARALTWASYHVDTTMKERLEAMPYRSALWRGRYPVLAGILEDEAAAPKGNVVTRNVCWGGRWDGVAGEARAYVDLSGNVVDIDPLFLAEPPSSFELAENSPAWGKGFEPIPLREIGLYADGYRRQGVR